MEDLIKELKDIIWVPYLSHSEKTEHIINLLELAYQRGYLQGRNDTKDVVMTELKNILGD